MGVMPVALAAAPISHSLLVMSELFNVLLAIFELSYMFEINMSVVGKKLGFGLAGGADACGSGI